MRVKLKNSKQEEVISEEEFQGKMGFLEKQIGKNENQKKK